MSFKITTTQQGRKTFIKLEATSHEGFQEGVVQVFKRWPKKPYETKCTGTPQLIGNGNIRASFQAGSAD